MEVRVRERLIGALVLVAIVVLVFLPVFLTLYWATSGRARLWVMLAGSLVFYAWWDWRFVFLLLFSSLVDYSLGILLEDEADERLRPSATVW